VVSAAVDEQFVTVRLLGLPLHVHARAQQQSDAMRREFQLIVEQEREQAGTVPVRLLELSTLLSARYEGFSEEQEERIEAGIEAGEQQLDELVFTLPTPGKRRSSWAPSWTRPTSSAGRASC